MICYQDKNSPLQYYFVHYRENIMIETKNTKIHTAVTILPTTWKFYIHLIKSILFSVNGFDFVMRKLFTPVKVKNFLKTSYSFAVSEITSSSGKGKRVPCFCGISGMQVPTKCDLYLFYDTWILSIIFSLSKLLFIKGFKVSFS